MAEGYGWRLWELDEVEVPPCRLYVPQWPVTAGIERGGVVAERRPAAKWLWRLERAHTAAAKWSVIRVQMAGAARRAWESAYVYNAVYRFIAFAFPGDDEKLARMVRELRLPRLRRPWTAKVGASPLDLSILTERLREGGGLRARLTRLAELALATRIAVAPGFELRLAPGEDNSLLLLGAPGTGKSAFLDYLLSRLPPSWSVLVIDPTGEHAVLARYGYKCLRAGVEFFANPLELGPAAAQDVLEGVIEGSWGERVTPIQSYMLSEALLKARTMPDVVDYLVSQVAKAGREDLASAAAPLLRRLRPLAKCPALLGHGGLPRGRVVLDGPPEEVLLSPKARKLGVGIPKVVRLYKMLAEGGLKLPEVPLSPARMASLISEVVRCR